jgi:hypothetical protein
MARRLTDSRRPLVTAVFVLLGAFAGGGVMLVASGLKRRDPTAAGTDDAGTERALDVRRLATAGVLALAVLIVTRWPVGALLAVVAVYGLRGLAGNPSRHVVARLEAIATWTEMLRDTLAAAAGLSQAIAATAQIAPIAIREDVRLLASRMASGVSTRESLTAFAAGIGDQSADIVVASLLMATEHRAQRLGDLLSALAETSREQVSMRLRIEASRAAARTAVRTIAGFTVGFVALMAVFAHSYLAPFGSAGGQLVLAVVGGFFFLGLSLMGKMASPSESPRLTLSGVPA